jgi:hypothetical protein
MCRMSWNSGSLNLLETSGPHRDCYGTAFFTRHVCWLTHVSSLLLCAAQSSSGSCSILWRMKCKLVMTIILALMIVKIIILNNSSVTFLLRQFTGVWKLLFLSFIIITECNLLSPDSFLQPGRPYALLSLGTNSDYITLEQRFSNFFQVGTTFISQNVLRTTLLLSPLKANLSFF